MTLVDRLYALSVSIAEAQHATPTEAPHGARLSVADHLRRAQREIADALGELAAEADTLPPGEEPTETAIEQAKAALRARGIEGIRTMTETARPPPEGDAVLWDCIFEGETETVTARLAYDARREACRRFSMRGIRVAEMDITVCAHVEGNNGRVHILDPEFEIIGAVPNA